MIEIYLTNPETKDKIYPNTIIKLNRFDTESWILNYGWFNFNGNNQICGWYLTNKDDPKTVRPLQMNDLDDIYLIER